MKSTRVQWNMSAEDAETVLQILKDYGDAYTRNSPRHANYDNDLTVAKLKKLAYTATAKNLQNADK